MTGDDPLHGHHVCKPEAQAVVKEVEIGCGDLRRFDPVAQVEGEQAASLSALVGVRRSEGLSLKEAGGAVGPDGGTSQSIREQQAPCRLPRAASRTPTYPAAMASPISIPRLRVRKAGIGETAKATSRNQKRLVPRTEIR